MAKALAQHPIDPVLFGDRYTTLCGHVNNRMPTFVTAKQVAAKSLTGALAFGSTAKRAQTQRFICPDVWCPASKTAMTHKMFRSRGKTCASKNETPVIDRSAYFSGKGRHPGFMKPGLHPKGMCMPCCFRKAGHRCSKIPSPSRSTAVTRVQRMKAIV